MGVALLGGAMSILEQYELCELTDPETATLVGFRRAIAPWLGVQFELWAWDALAGEVRRRRSRRPTGPVPGPRPRGPRAL